MIRSWLKVMLVRLFSVQLLSYQFSLGIVFSRRTDCFLQLFPSPSSLAAPAALCICMYTNTQCWQVVKNNLYTYPSRPLVLDTKWFCTLAMFFLLQFTSINHFLFEFYSHIFFFSSLSFSNHTLLFFGRLSFQILAVLILCSLLPNSLASVSFGASETYRKRKSQLRNISQF